MDAETAPAAPKRRIIFWTVVALVGAIMLAVVGALVFSFVNAEQLVDDPGGGLAAYLTVYKLRLELVMLAGALGAVLGDSAVYWLARTGPRKLKARLKTASQNDERVEKGLALIGRSGPLLIACGRFVPGVRFAVNVSMGLTEYPYRRFLLFSAIGGTAWAVYTCLLAHWVGSALAGFPLASMVVSGIVTTILILGVYWIDRRRHPEEVSVAPSRA